MRSLRSAVVALALLSIWSARAGAATTDGRVSDTPELTTEIHCVTHHKGAKATVRFTSHVSQPVRVSAVVVFSVVGEGERARVDLPNIRVAGNSMVVKPVNGSFDRTRGQVSCRVELVDVQDRQGMHGKSDRCALRALAKECRPRT